MVLYWFFAYQCFSTPMMTHVSGHGAQWSYLSPLGCHQGSAKWLHKCSGSGHPSPEHSIVETHLLEPHGSHAGGPGTLLAGYGLQKSHVGRLWLGLSHVVPATLPRFGCSLAEVHRCREYSHPLSKALSHSRALPGWDGLKMTNRKNAHIDGTLIWELGWQWQYSRGFWEISFNFPSITLSYFLYPFILYQLSHQLETVPRRKCLKII